MVRRRRHDWTYIVALLWVVVIERAIAEDKVRGKPQSGIATKKIYTADIILRLFAYNEKIHEPCVHCSYLVYDDMDIDVAGTLHHEFTGRTRVARMSTKGEYIMEGESTYETVLRPRMTVLLNYHGKLTQKSIGVVKWYIANQSKIVSFPKENPNANGTSVALFLKMEAWPTFANGHLGTETKPPNATKIGVENATKLRFMSQLLASSQWGYYTWENHAEDLVDERWLPNAAIAYYATDLVRIKRDLLSHPVPPSYLPGTELQTVESVEGDYEELI
eukprot:TRINITY_DN108_c0_g1_i1.p1 TRINITY_DN108_c0_g1~~TRINITY_DN108_c0_g1_i1.p1  ORF type:complete len:276 (+),score=21.54 TRINITY_DN108_c0_g1_i1:80-907(+)